MSREGTAENHKMSCESSETKSPRQRRNETKRRKKYTPKDVITPYLVWLNIFHLLISQQFVMVSCRFFFFQGQMTPENVFPSLFRDSVQKDSWDFFHERPNSSLSVLNCMEFPVLLFFPNQVLFWEDILDTAKYKPKAGSVNFSSFLGLQRKESAKIAESCKLISAVFPIILIP